MIEHFVKIPFTKPAFFGGDQQPTGCGLRWHLPRLISETGEIDPQMPAEVRVKAWNYLQPMMSWQFRLNGDTTDTTVDGSEIPRPTTGNGC